MKGPGLVVCGLAVALLAGCGLPAEGAAREITPPSNAARALASRAPAIVDQGPVPQTLFLVRDDRLVPVIRYVRAAPTLDGLLQDLVEGPTEAEGDIGLTSALLGIDVVTGIDLVDGGAVVHLAAALPGTGRNDEVLAYAQIVCTLTTRPEVSTVSFSRGGALTGVPRADGSLSDAPLSAADYQELLQ